MYRILRRNGSTKIKPITQETKPKVLQRFPRVRIHPRFPHLKWESVIGLEIHAQIKSEAKLFSGSAAGNSKCAVNEAVSYFDAAFPGTLPTINKRCVEAGIRTALALNCDINRVSTFDRKHYFYADMPAGYQITQQRNPLATNGKLDFTVLQSSNVPTSYTHSVGITQLQLEQDSGKSLHDESDSQSLIDLNRAGTGLMEIVFEPQIFDGEEAAALIKELSLILETLEVCSCKMDEGALRVDANISVRPVSDDLDLFNNFDGKKKNPLKAGLGVRTEVKNLNSIRSVVKAIEFEVTRQIEILKDGKKVENETRSFDAAGSKETVPMRDKEAKQDYRFIPEPNLPPLRLRDSQETANSDSKLNSSQSNILDINKFRQMQPVLPNEIRKRLLEIEGLSMENAFRITQDFELLEFFQECLKLKPKSPNVVANILMTEVLEFLNENSLEISRVPLKPSILVEISNLKVSRDLPHNLLVQTLFVCLRNPNRYESAEQVISERKWRESSRDVNIINSEAETVISANPSYVKMFLKGKEQGHKNLLKILNDKCANELDMSLVSKVLGQKLEDLRSDKSNKK